MAPRAKMRFGMDVEQEEKVEVQEQNVEVQKPITDEGIQDIADRLSGTEDAPGYEEIADWKNEYGVIYASTIHMADDLFIFRPLKRLDYKKIVASGAAKSEDKYEEALVKRCLLYPTPDAKFLADANAGTIQTLRVQIEFKSGFIPEALAIELIKVI